MHKLPPLQQLDPWQSHAAAYRLMGWMITPIPAGSKAPRHPGWNTREVVSRFTLDFPPAHGMGLCHAYSGTMAVDIDDWAKAYAVAKAAGVDLSDLANAPDAVWVVSGRENRLKLLYRMPVHTPSMSSKKLMARDETGRAYNFLDLRCATADGLTVQDVLPPSIHPDTGRPYVWGGRGDPRALPVIPDDLFAWWSELLVQDNRRTVATGNSVPASWQDIDSLLNFLSPDCDRSRWIEVAMALHYAGHITGQLDHAYNLWDKWSQGSALKYPGAHATMIQWRAIRSDKTNMVRLGTLFHYAKQAGWVRPTPDVRLLFGAVTIPGEAPQDLSIGQAPDFDLDLIPPVLAARAREISTSVGCDPLVPVWAGLAAACGAADARSTLELAPGFTVPPLLWLMTIGRPSDKKTPGSMPMVEILRNLENQDMPQYHARMLAWEIAEAAYAQAKKSMIEWAKSPEALLDPTGAPSVPDLPAQPQPPQIVVQDISSQKLVRLAAGRPKGLLCHLDEMLAWTRKLCDPRGMDDRSSWVAGYEVRSYRMDRVGGGQLHADPFAVAIFGNMQPSVLSLHIEALAADGLLQRFIPAVLRPNYTRLANPVPSYLSSSGIWDAALRVLHSVPTIAYTLSAEGKLMFREWQTRYFDNLQAIRISGVGDWLLTALGKLEGLAGRLALVFHLLEHPLEAVVRDDTLKRALAMVDRYITPALTHVLADSVMDEADIWLQNELVKLAKAGDTGISVAGLRRAMPQRLTRRMDPLRASLVLIGRMSRYEHAQWVARIDDGSADARGIADWAINPAIASVRRSC